VHSKPQSRPFPSRSATRARVALGCAFGAAAIAAHADCIDDAAARHQVNALILRAIGWHESRLQPAALGRNADGSTDLGAFQINSVHLTELGRYGIDRAALADGCTSAEVAAWHYRRQVDQHGDGWQAVGAYHSRTPARAAWYANQIAALLMRWNAIAPRALPYPVERTLGPARAPLPARRAPMPAPPPGAVPPDTGDVPATFREIAYLPTAR
jgi:Tfp pilus assembly protein PilV